MDLLFMYTDGGFEGVISKIVNYSHLGSNITVVHVIWVGAFIMVFGIFK